MNNKRFVLHLSNFIPTNRDDARSFFRVYPPTKTHTCILDRMMQRQLQASTLLYKVVLTRRYDIYAVEPVTTLYHSSVRVDSGVERTFSSLCRSRSLSYTNRNSPPAFVFFFLRVPHTHFHSYLTDTDEHPDDPRLDYFHMRFQPSR